MVKVVTTLLVTTAAPPGGMVGSVLIEKMGATLSQARMMRADEGPTLKITDLQLLLSLPKTWIRHRIVPKTPALSS